jgi:hypothetical protein
MCRFYSIRLLHSLLDFRWSLKDTDTEKSFVFASDYPK